MRLSFALLVLALVVVLPLSVFSQSALPRMVSVEPAEGKAGDVLTVTGENLEKSNVAEVYFTDGKDDIKLQVLEQTATTLKAKVPAGCKKGRWALMILTAGKDPKLIEQPVKFTVQ